MIRVLNHFLSLAIADIYSNAVELQKENKISTEKEPVFDRILIENVNKLLEAVNLPHLSSLCANGDVSFSAVSAALRAVALRLTPLKTESKIAKVEDERHEPSYTCSSDKMREIIAALRNLHCENT